MPVYNGPSLTGGSSPNVHHLQIQVQLLSQNVAANTSTVAFSLRLEHDSGSPGSFSGGANPWTTNFGGNTDSGTSGYDFTGGNTYGEVILDTGSYTFSHNADGTKSINVSGTFNASAGTIGSGSTGTFTYTLPTIPRASTATFSPSSSLTSATAVTINTNRASTSFTHDITYSFQGATGTVATAVGASTSWTPPDSLIAQIPNATSASGSISVVTKSGATVIGTKTTAFTLAARAGLTPTFSSATSVEGVTSPNVNTIVGKFVQNVSKVTGTIVGAAGVQSSTIASQKFTVAGQTVTGASGTTPNPINTSGASVPVVFTVTDSRGRIATQTNNIAVLAYATPAVNTVTVNRATSGGVIDTNGTYIRVDLNAAVSSLVNTTERNRLTIKAYTSPRGTNTWTLRATPVSASTTLTYNSNFTFDQSGSPFIISSAFDVKVEITDQFNVTNVVGTIPTAQVFQHWSTGLGLGKYWQAGMLDVAGDINGDSNLTLTGSTSAVTANRVRITSTGDASVSSTTHGFMIGDTTSTNLIIDQNELMTRNNGGASSLGINLEGGTVTIGSTSSATTINGFLLEPGLPDPLISQGPTTSTLAGSAATFTNLPSTPTLSFGALPRPMLVQVTIGAEVASTIASSYARVGVNVTGGLTLDPTTDGYSNTNGGFAPYSANADITPVYSSRMMVLPTTSVTFTMQSMRQTTSGTQTVNYPAMQVIPLRFI